jgi:cysteinyl-tRNA synthetase
MWDNVEDVGRVPIHSLLIFPHHENEIAQSESLTGKPFARYWVHTGLLHMEEEKMAHSGSFVTVKSALEVTPAPALRLYLLSQSYRTPFTCLPEQVGARCQSHRPIRDPIDHETEKDCTEFSEKHVMAPGSYNWP